MSTEKERFGRDPFLVEGHKARLAQLLGKVSQFAIDKIKNELDRLKNEGSPSPSKECSCGVKFNFALPCRHQLLGDGEIPLSSISPRWLLNAQAGHNIGWLTIMRRQFLNQVNFVSALSICLKQCL